MDDMIDPKDEQKHQSFVVRCWRGPDGELRGQLVNPVTQRLLRFTSVLGLHEVLNRVVEDLPDVGKESGDGGEQA